MAQALPQSDSMASMQRPEYEHEGMNVLSSTAFYHMQDAAQYGQMHGMQRPQPQGVYQPMQPSMNARQPGLAFQPQGQYPRMDMYGYPAGAVQHSPIDPRFNPTAFAAMSGPVNPELGKVQSPSTIILTANMLFSYVCPTRFRDSTCTFVSSRTTAKAEAVWPCPLGG